MAEVWPRVFSVSAAAIGLWLYSGEFSGPIWAVLYLAGLFASYFTLRPANPDRTLSIWIGFASHAYIALVFASLPLMLIASDDMVLAFCGIFGIVGLGAFTLFNKDLPVVAQLLDVAIGWAAIAIVAVKFIPASPTLAAQGVMTLLCLVVGGYYTLALLTARAVRVDMRAEVQRENAAREIAAVGHLSGRIAHDFNNILTAVQGSLELYHEVPTGPEKDALVDEAREASKRATKLVSQLLAYAQRAPKNPVSQPVEAVLDDVVGVMRHRLPEAVDLDVRLADQAVHVIADHEALRSALLQVLFNAAEAVGHQGTIVVAADMAQGAAIDARSTISDDPTDAHVRFSVSDDGPGMSPDVLHRATEPFFTTKTVGRGSGLGLSMASGFAGQAGGALRTKSSELGTIVSLHLPLAAPKDPTKR